MKKMKQTCIVSHCKNDKSVVVHWVPIFHNPNITHNISIIRCFLSSILKNLLREKGIKKRNKVKE